jgi:hypothetical protein
LAKCFAGELVAAICCSVSSKAALYFGCANVAKEKHSNNNVIEIFI